VTTSLAVAAVLGGLVVLEAGAERFTEAIAALARRLRASEGAVGLLTAGGEWEELVVVVLAALGGHSGVAIGNVIGACLANLIGSMPLGMLARRPLRPDQSARVYAYVLLFVTALAVAFMFDGHVSPAGGGVLVAVFLVYVGSVLLVIRRGWLRPPVDDDDDDDDDAPVPDESAFRVVATLVLSLALIAGAAEAIVLGAVHVAHEAGLSEYAIGATVVAIGTTLPDKAISFVGGMRGQGGVVTSNALGSNIFVLTLVLGLAALSSSSGISVAHSVTRVDLPLLLAATVLVVALFHRTSLHGRTGVALLSLYAGYIAFALVRG
jgi:Ca2+/Na+ antiporter